MQMHWEMKDCPICGEDMRTMRHGQQLYFVTHFHHVDGVAVRCDGSGKPIG